MTEEIFNRAEDIKRILKSLNEAKADLLERVKGYLAIDEARTAISDAITNGIDQVIEDYQNRFIEL